MDMFTENGEVFISEHLSKELENDILQINKDFNELMHNGITFHEGAEFIDKVITMLMCKYTEGLCEDKDV